MNVLFHHELDTAFRDYGILIPIHDDRSELVFNQLKNEFLTLNEFSLAELPDIRREDLLRAHDEDFVTRFLDSKLIIKELLSTYELIDHNGRPNRYDPERAIRPLAEMRDSIFKQVAATHMCLLQALKDGFCFFLGGGMHHAMSFGGRGFCPLNDLAISVLKLRADLGIKKVWIIDVDAHKGDGTAEIFHCDPLVKTLSIHMKKGWPLDTPMYDDKGLIQPWYIPSDIDIPIEFGEESTYLEKLQDGLNKLSKLSTPELVVIVDGADPYELDELPSTNSLKLTKEQMLQRDLMLYNFCEERKIPQAYVMAGGYGKHSFEIYLQFLQHVLKARGA